MAQHRHDANVQSEKFNNFSDSNCTTVALFYNYFIFKSYVNIVLLEQVNNSKKVLRGKLLCIAIFTIRTLSDDIM